MMQQLADDNMKTITLKLYAYEELSKEAQKRALRDWNEYNDDPMMQSHMINLLKEELDERGIKYDEDSMDVRYSLSYSQGDGFMFIGKVMWRGEEITITHGSNMYCHSKTADFDYENLSVEDFGQFLAVYEAVCNKMEQTGYDYIEYEQSEENFIDVCEANEYTFEENGKMRKS